MFLIIILLTVVSLAQTATVGKLDSLFVALDRNSQAMGSLAISKNGHIVYKKVIGQRLYTDEKKIESNLATKYRIGSISKMFTAVIIFQLIEEGQLALNSSIKKYFPGFPNAEKITIGNLLNHTSGIPNIKSIRGRGRLHTEQQMLKIITQKKGWTAPGTIPSYSNCNFLLLGYIIEKVTGKLYSDVLNERIVSRIGLPDTYFGQKVNVDSNESYSYCLKKKWQVQRQTHSSIPGASGGIVSTPADLVKFIEALFSNKLVTPASLEQMKNISNEEYGMGLFLFKLDNKRAFGHPGGIDRFESVVAYFPEDSLAVAYCSNGQVYPVKDVVIGCLNIYFGKTYSIPDFKPVVITLAKLKKYEGIYSSSQIPLKITVWRNNKKLVAKPVDHSSSFDLYPVSAGKFRCDEINAVLEFDVASNQMKLNMDGKIFNFRKEN